MEKSLQTMEEARASIPESTRARLEKVFEIAIVGKGSPDRKVYFDKPNDNLKAEVNKILGKDVNIDNQVITLGYIRHINNRHGIKNPKLGKNEIPVTKELFALIPDVLNNFNIVEKSNSKTSRGEDVVKITRQYSDGTMTIVDAIIKKDQNSNNANLAIRTIYVDKSGGRAVAPNYSSIAQKGVYGTNPVTY